MEGSALREQNIIQFPDQHTGDLHAGVSQNLNKAGHPVTAVEVNPNDQSPLEKIRQTVDTMTKDPVRVVGGMIEEGTSGESPTTHVGTVEGKTPIAIAIARALKGRVLGKVA